MDIRNLKKHLFLWLIWSGLGLCWLPGRAAAQSVTVNLGAGVGSGLELGGPRASTAHHSPVFVTAQVGLLLDNDDRFEVGGSLLMEVEGRVGVGVQPELRVHAKGKRVHAYCLLGVPVFFAPYTLFGFSVGPGVGVRLGRALSLFGELTLRAYPFGSDLPDGAAIFHGDVTIGVRHAF